MKSIIATLNVIRDAVTQFERETSHRVLAGLIGGHAVIFSGVERTTLDVDICFHSTVRERGQTFHHFLQGYLGARFQVRFIEASRDPDDPIGHDLIILNDKEGEYPRIDILVARYKWELEGLRQAKVVANLGFPIMPLPHLLAMKLRASGRKDELDVLELLTILSDEEMKQTRELAKKVGRDRKLRALLKESEKK